MVIYLKGLSGPTHGKFWEGTGLFRVGRLSTLELHFRDASLSRVHAELSEGPGGWVVRDLGSTNGTFLNGKPVEGAAARLHPGDLLQFGGVQILVTEIGEPAPQADAGAW
jgi:pSer/pThr/pTyr-binding forkhead associated (FHA) protein